MPDPADQPHPDQPEPERPEPGHLDPPSTAEAADPETDPHAARLSAALTDAAAAITPADRLGELRRATAAPRPSRRRRAPVVLGAALATAAVVIGGVVIDTVTGPGERPAAGPAGPPVSGGGAAPTVPAALYFLGDSPTGTRLYREFGAVPGTGGSAAVLTALQALTVDRGPTDPDYRTAWPAGAFTGALITDDTIEVEISDAAEQADDTLGPGEATMALQQVVYTAEAVIGRRLPVRFVSDGAPVPEVLGATVTGPVERNTQFATTAPVNISDPAEGVQVDHTLIARGTVSVNISSARWRLLDAGGEVLTEGRVRRTEEGAGGSTRFAPGWETEEIDLSGLAAGDYVFEVRVRDIGQTSEDTALFTDDRTITVR